MSSFVPSGYLKFSDALDRVASVLHIQKREAQKTLRELLYSGQVPSQIIERSGQTHDTPLHVWGGTKWNEALKSGAICFEVAAYAPDACGRIIIPQSRLFEILESRIPQKTGTHQRGTTEVEDDGVDPVPLASEKPEKIALGRPSLETEIKAACRELISNGKAHLNSRKLNYEPIRQIIRIKRNLSPGACIGGLGDEAIRKVIAPILDESKAKTPVP